MTRAYRVLWFGQFAAVAGLTVVVPLMPFYLAVLGVPAAQIPLWTGAALAAPAVTQLVTAPLWGKIGDRYGHKAMVVRAHAGLALAVGLMALADTPAMFLAFRLLQGTCGGVVSATAAYATCLAADERRGRALGGLTGATAAGALVGPLLGGVLAARYGYGVLFAGVAALLTVSCLLSAAVLPRWQARRQRTVVRASLRTVAGRLLRTPSSRALLLAGLTAQAATFALVVVFAPQVESITGSLAAATVWVGVLQALTWAASLIGGPLWGRLNDRLAPHRGFAVAALCCGVAVALQAVPGSPELLVPLRIAQGFCLAAFAQTVLYMASQVGRAEERGTAVGFGSGMLDIGQIAGPLLGALAAATLPAHAVFAVIGALLGLAAVLSATARTTKQAPADPVRVPAEVA